MQNFITPRVGFGLKPAALVRLDLLNERLSALGAPAFRFNPAPVAAPVALSPEIDPQQAEAEIYFPCGVEEAPPEIEETPVFGTPSTAGLDLAPLIEAELRKIEIHDIYCRCVYEQDARRVSLKNAVKSPEIDRETATQMWREIHRLNEALFQEDTFGFPVPSHIALAV